MSLYDNPPQAVQDLTLLAKDLHQTLERICTRVVKRTPAGQEPSFDRHDTAEIVEALQRPPSWAVHECRISAEGLEALDPSAVLEQAKICSATSTAFAAGLVAGQVLSINPVSNAEIDELMRSVAVGSAFELAHRALKIRDLSEPEAKRAAMEAAIEAKRDVAEQAWLRDQLDEIGGVQ
jgi:hypothetical protein